MNPGFILIMICNVLVQLTFIICVTIAAVQFANAAILLFALFTPLLGWSYSNTKKPTTQEN